MSNYLLFCHLCYFFLKPIFPKQFQLTLYQQLEKKKKSNKLTIPATWFPQPAPPAPSVSFFHISLISHTESARPVTRAHPRSLCDSRPFHRPGRRPAPAPPPPDPSLQDPLPQRLTRSTRSPRTHSNQFRGNLPPCPPALLPPPPLLASLLLMRFSHAVNAAWRL